MRLIFIGLVMLCLALASSVSAESGDDPSWSVAMKGNHAKMRTDDWGSVYREHANFFGMDLGWKYSRQLGVDFGISYARSTGKAKTITGITSNDDVTLRLWPVEISCVYRLAFKENQIVVPYAAAGYTHTFYQINLNADERKGDMSGYHARAGVRFLLDSIAPDEAENFKTAWRVENTFLFVEYYWSEVDDFGADDNDLGAEGLAGGLVFEF